MLPSMVKVFLAQLTLAFTSSAVLSSSQDGDTCVLLQQRSSALPSFGYGTCLQVDAGSTEEEVSAMLEKEFSAMCEKGWNEPWSVSLCEGTYGSSTALSYSPNPSLGAWAPSGPPGTYAMGQAIAGLLRAFLPKASIPDAESVHRGVQICPKNLFYLNRASMDNYRNFIEVGEGHDLVFGPNGVTNNAQVFEAHSRADGIILAEPGGMRCIGSRFESNTDLRLTMAYFTYQETDCLKLNFIGLPDCKFYLKVKDHLSMKFGGSAKEDKCVWGDGGTLNGIMQPLVLHDQSACHTKAGYFAITCA